MFPIVEARFLAPDVKLFRVTAPRVARKRQPGQFVIIRVHEHGERIPLTIADSCPGEGTVTLIVQGIGKTTRLMNRLAPGRVAARGDLTFWNISTPHPRGLTGATAPRQNSGKQAVVARQSAGRRFSGPTRRPGARQDPHPEPTDASEDKSNARH